MAEPDRLAQTYGLDATEMSSSGPLLEGDEKLEGSFENIQLVLGDANDLGEGQLFVTTRRVAWAQPASQTGLSTSFMAISLHAIAQTEPPNKRPCIYMQWEPSELDSESEDEDFCHELRFVPRNSAAVNDIFDLLSQSAALNPDDSDDEEDGGFFYDEEEALQAGNLDEGMLGHLDSLITMPQADELDELLAEDPDRFEDAQEDSQDQHANGHANR